MNIGVVRENDNSIFFKLALFSGFSMRTLAVIICLQLVCFVDGGKILAIPAYLSII